MRSNLWFAVLINLTGCATALTTGAPPATGGLEGARAAAGGGLAGFVDPIVGSDNVFYVGTDQHVHLLTRSPGASWTQDPRLVSVPVAASESALTGHMNAQSEEIFYIGADQHVYELWRWSRTFDGWHSTDVTLANGSKPLAAVGSRLPGYYDARARTDAVFYVATDQHVHQLLFSSGTWSGTDVTAASLAR